MDKNIKPKVSVIIPVYNTEKYLSESLNSIINQTLKDIEIIIINDGSTDSSLEIAINFAQKDNRIKIISNPNNGLSIARNLGIYKAIGEYIYFFDSDDLLEKDTLKFCYEKCKNKNLDFIFFDAEVFSDDNNVQIKKFNYIRSHNYEDKVYLGTQILEKQLNNNDYRSSVCLNFINRNYLTKIKLYFYPKILHEDELFTFILYLKAERVGFYNAPFFHRRVRFNSIMATSFGYKNVEGCLTVCRELNGIYRFYETSTIVKNLIKRRIHDLIIHIYSHMVYLPQTDYIHTKQIIINEFQNYLNIKEKLKLRNITIFNLLAKIKKTITSTKI